MAKGFAAGLVQGALVCGAGLVALSLAMPQPDRSAPEAVVAAAPVVTQAPDVPAVPTDTQAPEVAAVEPAPEPLAQVKPAEVTPEPPTEPQPAAMPEVGAPPVATPTPEAPPAAETLTVPESSGFARGEDIQPVAPAPLVASDIAVATPPAMQVPVDEATPGPAEPNALPEARGDAPTAPVMQAPAPDPVDLPQAANEAPIPVPPPGKVQTPALDRMPEQIAALAPDAAITLPPPELALPELALPETPPEPDVAEAAVADADPDADPELADVTQTTTYQADPGSGFDLSMPPDFGELHLTPVKE